MIDCTIEIDGLNFFGRDLSRPECVLCLESGDTFVSNWDGGVTRIGPDGSPTHILATGTPHPIGVNGFAITPEGDFLLADLNPTGGGVWRLRMDGSAEPFLLDIDGQRIPPTNFVGVDRAGRVWIRVFPDVPVSQKPAEVRQGKGKGAPEYWACRVKPGRIMFEVDGVPEPIARVALALAAAKLPLQTRVVKRLTE